MRENVWARHHRFADRRNLDYLLENIIDPSATVHKDYQMQVIQTAAGRIITGLVVAESEAAVTIQTVNEKIVVPTAEIDQRSTSRVSMMPDGALELYDRANPQPGRLFDGTAQAPLPVEGSVPLSSTPHAVCRS